MVEYSEIYQNTIKNNYIGLYAMSFQEIEGHTRNNTYHHNIFRENEHAFDFDWMEKDFIYANDFLENNEIVKGCYDASDLDWSVNGTGNYWDDFEENIGYPDYYEICPDVIDYYPLTTLANPTCGDADGNGIVEISDAVYLISYIFSGGPGPQPQTCVGDADGNGIVEISDLVHLISYIFGGGPAPSQDCCSSSFQQINSPKSSKKDYFDVMKLLRLS